jgi:TPP-dependent pyruvate/acetoin dehydrogenase alpha subunit
LDKELMLQLYRDMLLGRMLDERIVQIHARGLIPGSVFPGIGEEATFVGAARALNRDDYMVSSHRGHGHVLAKGTDPRRLLAEVMGKATGCCRGRIGAYAIADATCNNLGTHQVLGDGFTVAVGAALTQKRLKTGRMVLAFFGDGASSLGAFHESMNLSVLWRLPVVWVCDNNLYSMSTRFDQMSAVANVADRACAYNMPGIVVDGNDVMAVYETVSKARQRAVSGEGPSLIECKTYRHRGHSASDLRRYRPQAEVEAWLKLDPIARFEKTLRERGILDDQLVEQFATEARRCIDEAEEFAMNSPEPPAEAGAQLVFCLDEVR